MVVSATLRPSAELLPQVQRLEKPQVPPPRVFWEKRLQVIDSKGRGREKEGKEAARV